MFVWKLSGVQNKLNLLSVFMYLNSIINQICCPKTEKKFRSYKGLDLKEVFEVYITSLTLRLK